MSGIMSTRTFLLKFTRLMTTHQANLSKSALVFSVTKPPSGLVTVEGAPDVSLTSGMPEEERKQRVIKILTEGISDYQF